MQTTETNNITVSNVTNEGQYTIMVLNMGHWCTNWRGHI